MFGKISQLFRSRPKLLDPLDLSVLKTDVHSHFLPGIDDGSPDMETTLELIRGMKDFGFQKLITTPHVMSDYYKNTPEIILGKLDEVRNALAREGIDIEIDAAAEYYLDTEFLELVKQKDLLTFGDNYVLFELPFLAEPPNLKKAIFELRLAGYRPVLAHPERYSYFHVQFEMYQEMLDNDVILQLNLNSLSGHYSPEVRKVSEAMIDQGMIRMVGSDCHHRGHQELMRHVQKLPRLHELVNGGGLLNPGL